MIKADLSQLSKAEKERLDAEIKLDLVEHLYKSITPSVIVGAISAGVLFALLYKSANFFWLTIWSFGFCLTLFLSAILGFFYKRFKEKFSLSTWKFTLSFLIVVFTAFWGATVLFNPQDVLQQFMLMTFLFMAAASFSLATVGMFYLCLLCVCFILFPLTAWVFLNTDFYYGVGGVSILIYVGFLLGANYRSTKWLIQSLELSKTLASFTHQANYDLVTDLPNQRWLARYIESVILNIKTTNENFALISFGINRFEVFNNSLGYQAGDLIINSVGKRLKTQLLALNKLDKKERVLTKPRPDAFVILIVPIEVSDINKEINQLFLALRDPFEVGNRESRLSASVGVTIFPQDSGDSEKLLSNTYAAMFEAKSKGGNEVSFYKAALTSNAPLLLELENDLHDALERKEFEVYYQPLVDLHNGIISGVEALIRWNHPKHGVISPMDFIPIAEETNLILPIGEWVLEQATSQTNTWHIKGFNDLRVAVNLSAKQLRLGNLIETIDRVLKKTGLNPHYLELELTETIMLDENLTPLVKEISERGISLSIDDFGTGYSGLSYLKHFHVDKIKIDKSFIQDVASNMDSAAIVTATLAMAKELGIKTLAEGVETRDQLEFLQDRSCQYAQGYYFSKPVNAKVLEELLNQDIIKKL